MNDLMYIEGTIPVGNYGAYMVTYKLGNSLKQKIEILNYIDELNDGTNDLMFEAFGCITPTIISQKSIVGYIKLN